MTLIKMDSDLWMNPHAVNSVWMNEDGEIEISMNNDDIFVIEGELEKVASRINDAILIESAFSKVKT